MPANLLMLQKAFLPLSSIATTLMDLMEIPVEEVLVPLFMVKEITTKAASMETMEDIMINITKKIAA